MAAAGQEPVPNTPARAIAALDADLLRVLRGRTLEELGWTRPEPLTLLVPLVGLRDDGTKDPYLLRLHFGHYPEWPPSAQFVNPQTLAYRLPDDTHWLPKIEGTGEISVHPSYDVPNKHAKVQLICCSVTLEFYQVLHHVAPHHVWDRKFQNFAATLAAIEYGLRPPYYKGRQA